MNQQLVRTLAQTLWVVTMAVPEAVLAQTTVQESVLRVQGSAEMRVAPDLAVVQFGVVSEAGTAQAAQGAVNSIAAAVLDAVRRVGIDEQHLRTVRLALSPVYSSRRPDDAQDPEIVGYRASNAVSVLTEDVSLVAPVIDAALEAGANQLEGVSFGLQNDEAVRQQALRRAVAEAQGKAEAMAAALGVNLGAILTVTEEPGFVQKPVMEMSRAMALQSDSRTPVSPGEITVSASVSVEYRLSER